MYIHIYMGSHVLLLSSNHSMRSQAVRSTVPSGARLSVDTSICKAIQVPNSRIITAQKCEAVPRMARIEGSWMMVLLNSRLESNGSRPSAAPCLQALFSVLTPASAKEIQSR